MHSPELLFRLPQFEIKDFDEKDWKKVSERDFLIKLADTFETITPVLFEIFRGKEIMTCDCICRVKNY